MSLEREQKLIDICFSSAMLLTDPQYRERFAAMDREQVAEWMARQLRECGFPTRPCGMSWGVMDKPRQNEGR